MGRSTAVKSMRSHSKAIKNPLVRARRPLTVHPAGETLIILDFGSQYTQLIARRVREQHVFSKILPYSAPLETILAEHPKAIILSGSPANVYGADAPFPDMRIFDLNIPVLGICYGLQLLRITLRAKFINHKSVNTALPK
jgi:GMP synthase (glutamine-hydrolysing)